VLEREGAQPGAEGDQVRDQVERRIVGQVQLLQEALADQLLEPPSPVDVAVQRRGAHPEPRGDRVQGQPGHAELPPDPHDRGLVDLPRPAADLPRIAVLLSRSVADELWHRPTPSPGYRYQLRGA
jgi:hypothetical protein